MNRLEARVVKTNALATTTSRFCDLLALLDGGLHVVTTALKLTKGTFAGHLALQMLDCALDALIAYLDFQGPALN